MKQSETKQLEKEQPREKQPNLKQSEIKQPEKEQPREKLPGKEQPDLKQSETKQPEKEQPREKQPDLKQSDLKQSEPKQPEKEEPIEKQPDLKQSETKQPEKKLSWEKQPDLKQPENKQPGKKQSRVNLEAADDLASVIEPPLLTIQTAEDQTDIIQIQEQTSVQEKSNEDLGNQGEQNEQVSKSANPESLSTSIITTPGSSIIQSECSPDFGSEQQRQNFLQCHLGMGNQNEGEGTSHVFNQESQSLTNNDGSNSQDESGTISSISSQKPKGWEVLGWVDAELTKNYLDTFKQQTHKLCIYPNFY